LAADLTVSHLLESGADGALVSIGGDLSAGGRSPEGGWAVDIEHPAPELDTIGRLAVPAGGVATSSTRSRRWHLDGRERHHIIDPWTGAPSTSDLMSVTVIARSGWLAEVHATTSMLAGSSEVLGYLERHDLSGVAVTRDHRVLATDDLAELRCEPAAVLTMGASR
jgi:thiamine biosynthesis lipoprotein